LFLISKMRSMKNSKFKPKNLPNRLFKNQIKAKQTVACLN
jgi:hypothetical protein